MVACVVVTFIDLWLALRIRQHLKRPARQRVFFFGVDTVLWVSAIGGLGLSAVFLVIATVRSDILALLIAISALTCPLLLFEKAIRRGWWRP
jgi:hypothetical protein